MDINITQAQARLQAERDSYKNDTTSNWAKALDIALDAIEKLQKIEKVIDDWNHDIPKYRRAGIDGDTYVSEIEDILLGCELGDWLK